MAFEMLRVRTLLTGLVQGGGLCTHFFRAEENEDPDVAIALVNNFWEAARSAMTNQITIQVSNQVDLIDGAGTLEQGLVGGTVVSKNGGAAGAALPAQTQGLLRLNTPTVVAGRRLRGRMFIPGPVSGPEGGVTVPGPDYQGDLTAAGNALVDASEVEAMRWVVWSRKNASYAPITGVSVWGKYAVLRSRRD